MPIGMLYVCILVPKIKMSHILIRPKPLLTPSPIRSDPSIAWQTQLDNG